MLNYPDRLVSFMALHTSENQTTVQLAQSSAAPGTASSQLHNAYQLLWRQWPDWQPGERRTATIALVPRVPEDITLHLSVVLKTPTQIADQQRWSSVVRIPFHTTTW
jgi:hypothetical protein